MNSNCKARSVLTAMMWTSTARPPWRSRTLARPSWTCPKRRRRRRPERLRARADSLANTAWPWVGQRITEKRQNEPQELHESKNIDARRRRAGRGHRLRPGLGQGTTRKIPAPPGVGEGQTRQPRGEL